MKVDQKMCIKLNQGYFCILTCIKEKEETGLLKTGLDEIP